MDKPLVQCPRRVAQSYSVDGDPRKGVFIDPNPFNDNVLLMRYVTRFIDGYDLKSIAFCRFKDFNAILVRSIEDYQFYITIEPSEIKNE